MRTRLLLAAGAGAGSVLFIIWSSFFVEESFLALPSTPAFFINLISLGLYVFYIAGFATLAQRYKNSPLLYASYVWTAVAILGTIYAYAYPEMAEDSWSAFVLGLAMAGSLIIVGWQMINLKNHLGNLAVWYGIFAMLTGTGILGFFGPTALIAGDLIAYVLASIIFGRAAGR